MSRGVNKVILVGNVGNDPETRYTPQGSAVTKLSLATSESWKDKQTGQQQERTEWHRVVFFNRLAEIASQYVRKGGKLYIEGSLRTSSWEQDGIKRYATDIIANEMQMLDSRQDSGQGYNPAGSSAPMQPAPGQSSPMQQPVQQPAQAPGGVDDFDDDIPF